MGGDQERDFHWQLRCCVTSGGQSKFIHQCVMCRTRGQIRFQSFLPSEATVEDRGSCPGGEWKVPEDPEGHCANLSPELCLP